MILHSGLWNVNKKNLEKIKIGIDKNVKGH